MSDPEPVASIVGEDVGAVIYSDGAVVTGGAGDVTCSAHGPRSTAHEANRAQCTHWHGGPQYPEPVIEIGAFFSVISADAEVLRTATERMVERDPETVAELLPENE